jgi:Protein of unknown function (DUF1203)
VISLEMNRNWNRRNPGAASAEDAYVVSITVNEGSCLSTGHFKGRVSLLKPDLSTFMKTNCRPETEILTGYPDDFRELPLLLRAYTSEDGQVDSKLIKDGDAEAIINRFFANPQVAYIHLRDGESGCYYARIERRA